jgi:hypothetical protein
MTLDEHIKKAEEDAKQAEFDTEWGIGNYFIDRTEALEYAKEHRQLAEWLKELKAYREARNEITRKMNSGQWSEGVVYGLDKAVRIMEKHLREVNADDE